MYERQLLDQLNNILLNSQSFCRSNALFNVWNSYEAKLPAGYYTAQLLATGDLLYKKGLFQLASVHCYGRYLASLGVQWNDDLVGTLQEKNIDTITATVSILLLLSMAINKGSKPYAIHWKC